MVFERHVLGMSSQLGARELLHLCAQGLLEVSHKELTKQGLAIAEPPGPESSLALTVQEIARACGLPQCQVFLSARDARDCLPFAAEPPVLVVGPQVVQTPVSTRHRFRIARALYLAREKIVGVEGTLEAPTLMLILGAGVREGCDALPPGVTPAEREPIEAEARRLRKNLPRKSRDLLRGVATEFLGQSKDFDPGRFLADVLSAAARGALLVCGDAEAALHEMAGLYGPRSEQVSGLMRFVLSDEYTPLRKEFGWA
jgi:hypothetical protein